MTVSTNNASVEMEVDTGASVLIISKIFNGYQKMLPCQGMRCQTSNSDRCHGLNYCHHQVEGTN